jgi:prevent-host-death family protein
VVERADRDDVPTVTTRRGKEVAAVVSIEVLRKYQEWEEREINRIIDERMANPSAGIPGSDTGRRTAGPRRAGRRSACPAELRPAETSA